MSNLGTPSFILAGKVMERKIEIGGRSKRQRHDHCIARYLEMAI